MKLNIIMVIAIKIVLFYEIKNSLQQLVDEEKDYEVVVDIIIIHQMLLKY